MRAVLDVLSRPLPEAITPEEKTVAKAIEMALAQAVKADKSPVDPKALAQKGKAVAAQLKQLAQQTKTEAGLPLDNQLSEDASSWLALIASLFKAQVEGGVDKSVVARALLTIVPKILQTPGLKDTMGAAAYSGMMQAISGVLEQAVILGPAVAAAGLAVAKGALSSKAAPAKATGGGEASFGSESLLDVLPRLMEDR